MITCAFEDGNVASPGLRHVTTSVMVIQNNQVLMGLRAAVPGRIMLEVDKWSLLGGFFDRDEDLLTAVKREVMEESGWEIEDVQLFRIVDKPDRPHEDRQNMDMVFIARAIKQVGLPDQEVKELKWVPFDALPATDQIAFDHGEDLLLYKKYLESPHPLPILG